MLEGPLQRLEQRAAPSAEIEGVPAEEPGLVAVSGVGVWSVLGGWEGEGVG